MANRERIIKSIGTLLLVLFSWYWSSVTLFSHEHVIDGERIMHSHPLASSSHTHSSSQVQTISYMAIFLALATQMSFDLCKFDGFKSEIAIGLTERIVSTNSLAYSLRAPPASLL